MFELSKKFFAEFCKIFEKESPTRKEAIEKYTNNSAFTTFVIDEINSIITNMGYVPQNENFRIDASGYELKHENLEKVKGFNLHCWNLKIAVEHENDPKDWLDEIIKIAHICCSLRVVIGYIPMKSRDTLDMERLKYSQKALKELDCKNNLQNGELLVILGNSGTGNNKNNYFNYKAYVFDPETFSFRNLEEYN